MYRGGVTPGEYRPVHGRDSGTGGDDGDDTAPDADVGGRTVACTAAPTRDVRYETSPSALNRMCLPQVTGGLNRDAGSSVVVWAGS